MRVSYLKINETFSTFKIEYIVLRNVFLENNVKASDDYRCLLRNKWESGAMYSYSICSYF